MTSSVDPQWPHRSAHEYGGLLAAFRLFQDRFAGAAPPREVMGEVTTEISRLSALLGRYQVDEPDRLDGVWPDLPGRGHPLLPEFIVEGAGGDHITGHVRFRRFHLGAHGAIHGGVLPLMFNDLIGQAVNHGHAERARTAYLKTDFRRVVTPDVDLRFEAWRHSTTGRKRLGFAKLVDAEGNVLAEAEALLIELTSSQP